MNRNSTSMEIKVSELMKKGLKHFKQLEYYDAYECFSDVRLIDNGFRLEVCLES